MILHGDCLEQMQSVENDSVDSVVTDPPYGISFMGKKWDYDVPKVEVWKEALRVLKAGGHILVACGTRTQHRMAVNIEDAGFEIRDIVAWVYGSGFPKSHNIGKNIEKIKVGGIKNLKKIGTKKGIKVETGTQGYSYNKEYVAGKSMGGKQISGDIPVYEINNEYEGWGTALKPAMELWTLARKPLSEKTVAENVLKWGAGGINIDECRVGNTTRTNKGKPNTENNRIGAIKGYTKGQENKEHNYGRFPANLIHDGSDEVVGLFPDTKSGVFKKRRTKGIWNNDKTEQDFNGISGDSGSASRFFYCAKASKSERNAGLEGFEEKCVERIRQNKTNPENSLKTGSGKVRNVKLANHHPTVKPIKLMQYLTRLITPKGGTVLDPYMGSGTTGIACKKEGFEFIGIELDEDYFKIANARIEKLEHQHELF